MNQSTGTDSPDRLEYLEEETKRLSSALKSASSQISFLQVAVLTLFGGILGGGYYLTNSGKLRIEGLSPPVAKTVESKEFGFYNRFNNRVMFDSDDKFGEPQIIFLDDRKELAMRAKVWPERGGAGLAYYDVQGWRGVFRLDGENAVLRLRGEGQKGGIDMSVAPDGTPSLKLTDKSGKLLWEAPTKSN